MNSEIRIKPELLSPHEIDLIIGCIRKNRGPDVTIDVVARPFPRWGFTGAKLYVLYFDPRAESAPYIVKIHKRDKIDAEYRSWRSVQNWFQHIGADIWQAVTTEKECSDLNLATSEWGAVIYTHVGAFDDSQVDSAQEFDKKLYAFDVTDDDLRTAIHGIYEQHPTSKRRGIQAHTTSLREEYEKDEERDYLRENTTKLSPTKSLLKASFGRDFEKPIVEFAGVKITNPLVAAEELFDLKRDLQMGPIHGDLHGSNLVYSPNGPLRIIDFAKADNCGHVVKDFALLENSVRFWRFPHGFMDPAREWVDQVLLYENGCDEILEAEDRFSDDSWPHVRRMASIVKEIRLAAREALGQRDFKEYLAGQFAMLYGSLLFKDYDFVAGVRTLGYLAGHLLDQ